jgi:hypothetical protein
MCIMDAGEKGKRFCRLWGSDTGCYEDFSYLGYLYYDAVTLRENRPLLAYLLHAGPSLGFLPCGWGRYILPKPLLTFSVISQNTKPSNNFGVNDNDIWKIHRNSEWILCKQAVVSETACSVSHRLDDALLGPRKDHFLMISVQWLFKTMTHLSSIVIGSYSGEIGFESRPQEGLFWTISVIV